MDYIDPKIYREQREYNLRADLFPRQQLTQLWQKNVEEYVDERLYNNNPVKPSDTKTYLGSGKN